MESQPDFEKYYNERYTNENREEQSLYAKQFIKWLITRGHLPNNKGIKILDLGCGTGLLYYALKELGYENVNGIDRTKLFPEAMEEDIEKGFHSWHKDYDLIISRDVIEHIRNPDNFLSESYRLLRKGGKIIIMTPATEKMTVGEFYHGYDHHSPFTKESLVEGLKLFGFKEVEGRYFRNIPFFWKYSLKAFDFVFSKRRCYALATGIK